MSQRDLLAYFRARKRDTATNASVKKEKVECKLNSGNSGWLFTFFLTCFFLRQWKSSH